MKIARLLLFALPLGCVSVRAQDAAPAAKAQAPSGEPRLLGRLSDARLKELSGLAASRRFPGWLWAHNDSGDSARLFLLDVAGRTRVVVTLANAQAVDWEDVAVAGDASNSSVTIADCGDNGRKRSDIVLYRFRERDLPLPPGFMAAPRAPTIELSVRAQSLRLRYPEADGAQDAESLCSGADGSLLLITKSTGPSRFYVARWPQATSATSEQMLRLVGQKQFGSTAPGRRRVREQLTTAADVSPDGSRLAVSTYAALHVWKLPIGAWDKLDWKGVLEGEPSTTKLPELPQCESVAWSLAGQLVVSSESEGAPLWSIKVARK